MAKDTTKTAPPPETENKTTPPAEGQVTPPAEASTKTVTDKNSATAVPAKKETVSEKPNCVEPHTAAQFMDEATRKHYETGNP